MPERPSRIGKPAPRWTSRRRPPYRSAAGRDAGPARPGLGRRGQGRQGVRSRLKRMAFTATASAAQTVPSTSARPGPWAALRLKAMATRAVPKLWPNTRVVACRPPAAAPARAARQTAWRGCSASGRSQPRPATNMPARMGHWTCAGSSASQHASHHGGGADAAHGRGRIAVGQPARQRRDQRRADRPGAHQHADFQVRPAQHLLEIEGQRHVGRHLRGEGAGGRGHGIGQRANAQQVHWHQRRGLALARRISTMPSTAAMATGADAAQQVRAHHVHARDEHAQRGHAEQRADAIEGDVVAAAPPAGAAAPAWPARRRAG